jgi:AcrR family transcriptional regulator
MNTRSNSMSDCSFRQVEIRGGDVSPRGVAIPELREQLFSATERVLARDGAGALTGRAITREAGCATGLLYNHFGDLDDFLTEFITDRMRSVAKSNETLLAQIGTGTVEANLVGFALSRFTPRMLHAVTLALARPGMIGKLRSTRSAERPPLGGAEATLVRYLTGERERGRIHAQSDPDALALALIGAIHHLLLTRPAGEPAPDQQIRRLVGELLPPQP